MTNKLTIGDRVITTRLDGEIGTVCGFRTWHRREQANVVFEIGEEKWIGVAYLTIAVTEPHRYQSHADDPNSSMMAVFAEF
jgi:hypothetical protein